jgi:hypothetical protein
VARLSQNIGAFDKRTDVRSGEVNRLKHSLAVLDNLCQSM